MVERMLKAWILQGHERDCECQYDHMRQPDMVDILTLEGLETITPIEMKEVLPHVAGHRCALTGKREGAKLIPS